MLTTADLRSDTKPHSESPTVASARQRLAELIRSGASVDECVDAREELDAAIAADESTRKAAERRSRITGDVKRARHEHERVENKKRLAEIDTAMFKFVPTMTLAFA